MHGNAEIEELNNRICGEILNNIYINDGGIEVSISNSNISEKSKKSIWNLYWDQEKLFDENLVGLSL